MPSIINKRHTILTKRLSVAIAIIGAFLYRGIPSDVQSRYEQPLNLTGTLLPVDNRQCVKSPMGVAKMNSTEKALTLTISDCIPVQEGVVLC